jgi:undecaprenyl pyrophosphate phosphatase UppP
VNRWWQALVLGVVQGLTEILPVSSPAHLQIVAALAGWPDPDRAIFPGDPHWARSVGAMACER